ncbi:MAG: hypothetical protein OEQ39_04475 [Gammaproteobacteria bacterium]|nr:hypothetical protein [Gammaproteobacteria bacterium]
MKDLIERLEAAESGSRELDANIALSMGGSVKLVPGPNGAQWPHYTTSIDAALTLVPEGWRWQVSGFEASGEACVDSLALDLERYGAAATPALALVIAALRAMEAENRERAEKCLTT